MGVRAIYISLFLLLSTLVSAQDSCRFDVAVFSHYRSFTNGFKSDPGKNGASFRLGYLFPLGQQFGIRAGAEIGAGGVSNYAGIEAGLVKSIYIYDDRVVLHTGFYSIQGSALFKGDGMYMYGFSIENFIGYTLKKGRVIGLALGFRYYSFPEYRKYSEVTSFGDFQTGLRYCF